MTGRPKVVVVGAGFGGLNVVRRLGQHDCDIVLVDRSNHHLFQPLLYQVATAALSPADIAMPIRSIVRDRANVQVLLGEVTRVDLDRRRVFVGDARIAFDWLVLAAGVTHAYFGHDAWADRAPGLKTVDDALLIRRRILLAFEEAEVEVDEEARRAKLTFVVVGGGPTGVEMAGALREIAAETIPDDFRRIDTTTAQVYLLEGGPRLLGSMSEAASRRARSALEAMGVQVRLNTFVTAIDRESVWAGDTSLAAANVIWAAGVEAAPLVRDAGVPLEGNGRVPVGPDCSIPGHPRVFVVGDLAFHTDPVTGRPTPGVAQGAIQMGRYVGSVIRAELSASGAGDAASGPPPRPREPFRYRDKGTMATIGRARAVADIGGRSFDGFFAWILWSLVHISFLIGFRNRLLVMINWAWQWLVQTRGARLITGFESGQDRSGPFEGSRT